MGFRFVLDRHFSEICKKKGNDYKTKRNRGMATWANT